MKQYLDIIRDILDHGEIHENRTGIKTRRIWGKTLSHDLSDGFPLLTTKKMAIKASFVEMLGFIRGETDVRWYQDRGCNIWNKNHEDWHGRQLEDDKLNNDKNYKILESIKYREQNPHSLGKIYGYQWRNLNGFDQLLNVYNNLKNRSNSRRLIMSSWNPSESHMMCLPPCHVMYHFSLRGEYLDIAMTQRSCDVGLGVPFNICNTALLCHIMAHCCELKPGKLYWSGNDVHIYENHVEQLQEQLNRIPHKLPVMNIFSRADIYPWDIEYKNISIHNYNPHPKIKMEMVV